MSVIRYISLIGGNRVKKTAVMKFTVESLERKPRVDRVLKDFGISYSPPEPFIIKGGYVVIDYDLRIPYEPAILESLMTKLSFVEDGELDFRLVFQFTEHELTTSPLFRVPSIGNIEQRYTTNKGRYQIKPFCDTCGRAIYEKVGALKINTANVEKQNFVYVDSRLVISEKIASLFNEWELTGYQLEQVEHYGERAKKRNAYEVIPTNILPSQKIPDEIKNDPIARKLKCPACGTGGHLIFPYHYSKNVSEVIADFNYSLEFQAVSEKRVKRNMLISRKVKELLIESGFTDEEWDFEPVILI